MSYDSMSDGGLDYFPCRYGASANLFRGPKRETKPPFVVALGGTETYGRFIRSPYPNLLESLIEHPVVNLGAINGSVELYLNDYHLVDMANMAQLTMVQISGAHNLNNRFYTVHPRRNDRFVNPSAILRSIYREVDFTEIHFTRHLLQTLFTVSEDRFKMIVEELRQAWVARMASLLQDIHSPVLLTLLARQALPESDDIPQDWLQRDPLLVTQGMVRQLQPYITRYIEIVPPAQALREDLEGMVFSELETPAARLALPPNAHRHAAETLNPHIQTFL